MATRFYHVELRAGIYRHGISALSGALLLICMLVVQSSLLAQGVGVNDTGNAPDPSAIFDASSTTQGLLIPRMTSGDRNAISTPAEGLMIFNTTTKCFEFYSNDVWQPMACSCTIPVAPSSGTHSATKTQVTWNWNMVSGATGYKFNTVDDFSTATDVGMNITYEQTGLDCGTENSLYVWAYNACGNSVATTLSKTTASCCVEASGGTITYSGGNTIHTFTSSGSFVSNCSINVRALVVGGGGGAGWNGGGGGGAGGFVSDSSYPVTANTYPVTVGSGGAGGTSSVVTGASGTNSQFGTLIALGGGGGAKYWDTGLTGGSGGGGGCCAASTGGAGTSGQGNSGGNGNSISPNYPAGGGGGAGTAGQNAPDGITGGAGGAGLPSDISGVTAYYAGGGGGACQNAGPGGAGGIGGGGSACNTGGCTGASGLPNTGGGGGAGASGNGGAGGTGVVIISYPTPE